MSQDHRLPITGIPETIARGMGGFRDLFCRTEGFEHISRYVTGLILSPNETLQGIYALQVWERDTPRRRAMHEAVFEAGGDSQALMQRHRAQVAHDHRGRGREVISLDWTLAHHERGPRIFGVGQASDDVQRRTTRFQTVGTAVMSNRHVIDGLEVSVQDPKALKEERGSLEATSQESYDQMEEVRKRVLERLHHRQHQLEYRQRTAIAWEIVQQLEEEGQFPQAHYAFDTGVLHLELTRYIEHRGNHWVSELECSRNSQWYGQWRRVDRVAAELKHDHPESFGPVTVQWRNGEQKQFWAFTKTVRLKRYGRKRLVIVHEKQDLADAPRFLVTDALHWESGRVIETWSYRWASEIFHEFGKQVTGLEAAQVRKEEAVTRHFRLSCVAQSMVQRAPVNESTSERYAFAGGQVTYGQKCRAIGREVMRSLLELITRLLAQGKSCDELLEVLMPA
jgi:hypothetical protein